jgi:hypothetical protein
VYLLKSTSSDYCETHLHFNTAPVAAVEVASNTIGLSSSASLTVADNSVVFYGNSETVSHHAAKYLNGQFDTRADLP